MAVGNFPFPYAEDFSSTRAGFEEENRRFIKPLYHPLSSQLSSVPSQVQYGYNTQNTADFWGNSSSSSDSPPVPVNEEEESEGSRRSYDKWTEPQEGFLIDLWGEYNNGLESAQSRRYWIKILERLNNKFRSSWSLNQIQRKIRYFKEQFKKVKDWNRKQTGGNRKSCPYFDKINEIIGKKDSVTFKHVVSAGNPSPTPPQEDQEQQSEKRDKEKGDGDDEAIKAKGKVAKQTRRERKLKRSPKPSLDDSFNEEEETKRAKKFEKTMENLENQGAKMVDTTQSIVTSMEAAQTQQVQFMGEFMKLFAGMTKQIQNKD